MPTDDLSPSRQQYLEIKREYPNTILFFRLGDFYETFDEDAEITARELDIVLTSRNVGKGIRAPLAGIPYHAVENYLARLIEKGYHVAICEQIGDLPIKGLFPRKVVRVVTPGTVTEPGLLSGDSNNYLASVVLDASSPHSATASVSYADITTGEFAVTELPLESLRAELTRLHPAEILLSDNQPLTPTHLPDGEGRRGEDRFHQTPYPAWRFEPGKCEETLLAHFKASSLAGFGLKSHSLSVRAAGAIIQYLKDTQPDSLALLTSLRSYSIDEFMTLDAATRRNLELDETLRGQRKGSLLGTLDQAVTPMGKRLMHQWVSQPLLDVEKIEYRQNGVQTFFDNGMQRAELRAALKPFADLERLVNRIMAGLAQPRDLVAMRDTLARLPAIAEIIEQSQARHLHKIELSNSELSLLQSAIDEDPPSTLQNTGIIHPGYSQELDSVIEASKHARDWIANLEGVEREKTGIKTLKVGYNKVFGYYIEISRGAADKAPESYIRKQTLVNAERFITPEMKEYETLVLNAEDRIREIELRLFKEVCAVLSKSAFQLLKTAREIAELDVLAALAEVAALGGYTRPQVHDGRDLEINEGRHPVVEQSLQADSSMNRSGRYIPNDVIFEKGEVVRVITGPNMAGKSTYLRQTALIVLMAQMGSFVPADSANIGLVDRIFTRIGAQDEIHAGQSTFMVEMLETANILHHATTRSLLILDEIGRGTSTYDGVSIAWAVIEYIHNHPHLRAKTLFATHYHELTQLAELLPGIRNYNVAVSEGDGKVVFLHKIVPGGADRS
ncbi:MAG TPA: DNA mismatch repair protein MutS, partial [Anaerolineales bacterium]|nr:DNA mismatch repair protein MutS [Anaerolineales bacterium]